jgi:cullin 3
MERYKRERVLPPLVPGPARPVDLDVTVLTMVNWPAVKLQPCRLPPQVAAAGEAFRTFYLALHTGRRLTWHTDKGTAEVVFTPAPGRRHELTVSTYQMVVLTLFNAAERVPFSRMVESVGVPAEDLGRHVLSLLNPKVPVLRRTGGGSASAASLDGADVLSVNTDFTSKMLRIRVPLISAKSAATASAGSGTGAAAADEDGDIAAQLETQRKSMLDAAIVRIMKARRTLDYANLVAEVTRQLSSRFVPAPQDIKKRVEDLIEREYLERDASDKKLYSYVA